MAAIEALVAGLSNPLQVESAGNKVALFSSGSMANAVAQASLMGNTTYSDAGFGAVQHFGNHRGYNDFMIAQVDAILTDTALNSAAKQAALFDLHRFGTDLANGQVIVDGETLGLMGPSSYLEKLQQAWDVRKIDVTDPDAVAESGLADYMGDFAGA